MYILNPISDGRCRYIEDLMRVATAVAKTGMEDSVICTLGRWNSLAFPTYMYTPQNQLVQFSKQ